MPFGTAHHTMHIDQLSLSSMLLQHKSTLKSLELGDLLEAVFPLLQGPNSVLESLTLYLILDNEIIALSDARFLRCTRKEQ